MDQREPAGARRLNRLRVIQALFREPGSSRAEIVRATGLSRPTVSALLEDLEAAGVVQEHDGVRPRGAGRPPVCHSLVPGAAFAIGLDVGHRHVRAAVCDLLGHPVADEWSAADVDGRPVASLDLARELVDAVLSHASIPRTQVVGVGVGLAAPVDSTAGTAHVEGILPGWDGLQPVAELQDRLGLPVRIANDANVGALGEHRFGAGRGVQDLAYVRLSAGIGLGLVLDGRLYGGAAGVAGELGHVCVEPQGLICRCGNRGCLETVASPVAICDLLRRSRGAPVGVGDLLGLMRDGDRGARRAVADAGAAVGRAVAASVNLLNPGLIVVGGELAAAGDVVLEPVREAIERHAVAPAAAAVRVVTGELGDRAEVLGAAAMLLSQAPQVLEQRLATARG